MFNNFIEMERGKNLCSSVSERQDAEKVKVEKNPKSPEDKNINENDLEYGLQAKAKHWKPSMIPVMKNEKFEIKNIVCKKRPASSNPFNASLADRRKEDFDYKLKVLKETEKSIAEYYLKIEEMIQKSLAQKKEGEYKKLFKAKTSEDTAARKMTSDSSVFSKNRMKSDISDFENNIQQISHIWLKTTADLSSTLKNLKSNPSVDPIELQMENIRIQLAIKQAKSLTLVKTRSVIAEAKKLFRNREIIRTELECLLNQENLKKKTSNHQKTIKEKNKIFSQQNTEEQGINGTGDSLKEADAQSLENNEESTGDQRGSKEKLKMTAKEALMCQMTKHIRDDSLSEEKDSSSDEASKEQNKQDECSYNSKKIISEMDILKKELLNKNKTITNLNKKIFDLQKKCNEDSVKYNQLQVKLFEFHEKIQWNQVLWKQIGKLKERIKGFQQSNKELELQKKDLEIKITRQEQEIDRLIKLNNILNQRKHLLNAKEVSGTECQGMENKTQELQCETVHEKCFKKMENKVCNIEKALAEKQISINQLKKILNVMKGQENFAQKQIFTFQSRIEELEKTEKI